MGRQIIIYLESLEHNFFSFYYKIHIISYSYKFWNDFLFDQFFIRAEPREGPWLSFFGMRKLMCPSSFNLVRFSDNPSFGQIGEPNFPRNRLVIDARCRLNIDMWMDKRRLTRPFSQFASHFAIQQTDYNRATIITFEWQYIIVCIQITHTFNRFIFIYFFSCLFLSWFDRDFCIFQSLSFVWFAHTLGEMFYSYTCGCWKLFITRRKRQWWIHNLHLLFCVLMEKNLIKRNCWSQIYVIALWCDLWFTKDLWN